MNRYVVAVTGASGMIYARELLAYFNARPDLELHLVISGAGEQVLDLELGVPPAALAPGAIRHRVDDFTSPLASGSFRARAMVVIPCSIYDALVEVGSYRRPLPSQHRKNNESDRRDYHP